MQNRAEEVIDHYLKQGDNKYKKGNYQGAIEDYNQAIRLRPNYPEAYYGRGNIKTKMQYLQEAIEDYNQAIRLKPNYSEAYANRGLCNQYIGNYKGAIEDYSQAIRLKPGQADAYQMRGLCNNDLKIYKEAIADFSQVIRLKPDSVDAYYNRGSNKQNMENFQGAVKDYSQVIRLKPDFSDAFNNRGLCKNELKYYKEAIEDYSQAIRLKPDFFEAYQNRGVSKKDMKNLQGAIADFSQAIRLKPNYNIAWRNRGLCKNELKYYKGAIEDYSQAIRLKPDFFEAYYNRGVSKQDMKNFQGAIEDYSQAIRLKPDFSDAYNNRGITKTILKNFKSAQQDFLEALCQSIQPSPFFLFNLANLYLEMGLKNEAIKRYNEGTESFQRKTQANLKKKFNFSDKNIQHIKFSIESFEKINRKVEQIEKQATKKGRNDINQELIKISAEVVSSRIKSTEEKANPNQTQLNVKEFEKKLDYLYTELKKQNKKRDKLQQMVEQIEKRIYTEKRINNMIQKINSKKLSEFYLILYNVLINHFIAYRMFSTGFFNKSKREKTTFDNVVEQVCKAQSIIKSLPILGDLVGIPFKLLNSCKQEKTSRLNNIIADKINGLGSHSEDLITVYMSHLVEKLIKNKPFNDKLAKVINNEQKGFLEQMMDMFGQFKEMISMKIFGGSSAQFSYAQKVVILYITRFTVHLYEVDNRQFQQHCQNEETFTAFFMECLKQKPKKQPKIEKRVLKEAGTKVFLFFIFILVVIFIARVSQLLQSMRQNIKREVKADDLEKGDDVQGKKYQGTSLNQSFPSLAETPSQL